MRRSRTRRLQTLVGLAVVLAAFWLPETARAANPAAVNFPLNDPASGESCPQAFFFVSPGAGPSPMFLIVPPGPIGCPLGLDMTLTVGAQGTTSGEAVALPLTATSCQAGTYLINSQITALGQTPGGGISSGPPGATSACPGGEAAWTQLEGSFSLISRLMEEEGIFYFFRHSDGSHTLVVAGGTGLPVLEGVYRYEGTGTPEGRFSLRAHASPPDVYALQPSGTPGVATIICRFC